MCSLVRSSVAVIAAILLLSNPTARVFADGSKEKDQEAAFKATPVVSKDHVKTKEDVFEIDLLKASVEGLVTVHAEGRGDGRMTVSVTNRSKRQLRVVLPPPTRLVMLNPPDQQGSVKLPEKGEPLELGDISQVSDNPQVQKAMRRLAHDKVSKPIARLVVWHLAGGLDWETLSQISQGWANRYELTLARDFVERLDMLPDGESGRVLFEVKGTDVASGEMASQLRTALRQKIVLGLVAEIGIPSHPEGPAVAFEVRLGSKDAQVLVYSSDGKAEKWVPFGKFSLPNEENDQKLDVARFADRLTEGVLNRLVRVQLGKGVRDKGKMHYLLRIDNASPLVLNGLAALGTESKPDDQPRVLAGICVSPRRSMSVGASEEVVKTLGLKKGIKLIALDLSGL
jgi:hypothetical protein